MDIPTNKQREQIAKMIEQQKSFAIRLIEEKLTCLTRENERYQQQVEYLQTMASEYFKMLEKALIIQDKTYGDGVALHLAMIDWARDTKAALEAAKEK